MILPAFPAKSPNPQKTATHKPDFGEVVALTRLNTLCTCITDIYKSGAKITICSDGRVFSDVVQVCDGAVDVYGREIRAIINERGLEHLATFSLDDVYSAHDYDLMRQRLVWEFAESVDQIRQRVKSDPDDRALFNGIHRFMFEDQLALQPERSKSWAREHAKGLAYAVIQRSNAWSRLVEKRFPDTIRLSIHPQPDHSPKIGVRLVNSSDQWRTPWHSVLVSDGQKYWLAPRAQAEAHGATLVYAENRYPYYVISQTTEAVS